MKKMTFFVLAMVLIGLYSCDDDKPSKSVNVGFYLTDAPALQNYKAVNIDVESIKYSTSGENWIDLPITPLTIDLLKFNNGKDTLLSNILLEANVKIQQIRLVLGSDNTLVLEDGTVVDLGTPSGQTSGLKINVQSVADITSGYKVVIDFDAARSIVAKGNGGYSLKPVIRAYITANTSAVSGNLLPADMVFKVFTVTSAGDTISTLSDPALSNYFQLHGLFSGTYDIKAEDVATEQVVTIKQGQSIIGGTNVSLGTITFPVAQ